MATFKLGDKADFRIFQSDVIAGSGAAQSTPHGLGKTPDIVIFSLVDGPAAYADPAVTEGAHDADNVVFTVASGWSYRVVAIAIHRGAQA